MYISRPEPPQSGVPMKVCTSKVFSKAEPLYMSGMYSQTSADKCLTWRRCDQDGAGEGTHGAGGGTDGAGRFFSDVPAPRICLLRPPVAQVRILFSDLRQTGCHLRQTECHLRQTGCHLRRTERFRPETPHFSRTRHHIVHTRYVHLRDTNGETKK